MLTLEVDEDGPHVTVQPDRRPNTVVNAEPEVILGLAAGSIPIDQALAVASVHGDRQILTRVFSGAQT